MSEHSAPFAASTPHADSAPRRARRLAAAQGRALALVLIDLQNDYCHPDGVFGRAGMRVPDLPAIVEATNALGAAARAAGRPVLWTTTVWDGDAQLGLLRERSPFLAREGLRRGTWGSELLADLVREPRDVVVEKRRFSAFHQTSLDAQLARAGVRTLVVAGVRTDFCVESTVRDAFFRDIDVFVAEEAVGGFVPALHESSLRLMNTVFAQSITTTEARRLLAGES